MVLRREHATSAAGTVLQVDLWLDSEHIKSRCGPHMRSALAMNRVHRMPADTKQRMQSYLEAMTRNGSLLGFEFKLGVAS